MASRKGMNEGASPPPDILPDTNTSTRVSPENEHSQSTRRGIMFSSDLLPHHNLTGMEQPVRGDGQANEPTGSAYADQAPVPNTDSFAGIQSATTNGMLSTLNSLLVEMKTQSSLQERRFEEQIAVLSRMSTQQSKTAEEHLAILSQMNNRQAQQDFTHQPIPQVSMDNASVWDPLHRSMMNSIAPTLDKWRGGLDTLLVFVGLFSGIVTSFLVDSFNQLQPDPVVRTNELLVNLTEIVVAINRNASAPLEWDTPLDFVPDPAGVRLNVYWALSLVIALTSAALAVLARGFISRLILPNGTARKKVVDLYQRWPNAQRTFGPFMSWLPLTLIIPVALFIVGLLDAMINSASVLDKPNVALIVMSVLGCMIVTLAVGLGIGAMIHGTLHPHASPFKIRIPFLWECWMKFRRFIPSLRSSLNLGVSMEVHAGLKELSAFHTVIGKTYEDSFLDSAAGALEGLFKHPLISKSPEVYHTMIHLLSPEASIRCNITVAHSMYQRHKTTSGVSISGLPYSPPDGKSLLLAFAACTRRNPRLFSVPSSQDDTTPTFCAATAITLVHYINLTDLLPGDIAETYLTLSKAFVDSPTSQPTLGMSYVLTALARMIANRWRTTHKELGIGSETGIYISDQGASLTTKTKLMLLSSHSLQWIPQVNADLKPIIEYIQSQIYDLLANIPVAKRASMTSPFYRLESMFGRLDHTGDLMALLLGILFWDNDKRELHRVVWMCIIDWIFDKLEARFEVSKVDDLLSMETTISGQAHINYAERLSYLAIKRINMPSSSILKICCRVLNTTWKPFQFIKHISSRPFHHLILTNQVTFDEILTIFVQDWNTNHHRADINTDIVRMKNTTYANIYTILFIALSHGLNAVHRYEEWSREEFINIVVRKVTILTQLEPHPQSEFGFVLAALSIHVILSQPAWNQNTGSALNEVKDLIQHLKDGIEGFIATGQSRQPLPLQGDILYLLHDKSKMEPDIIVAKAFIKLHECITAKSGLVQSLCGEQSELLHQLLQLHDLHQEWIDNALVNKE